MTVDREQVRRDDAIAGLRDQITRCVPDGFRDEDGVWHEGPHRSFALACLDALLTKLEQAERERDEASETIAALCGDLADARHEANAAEAQLAAVPALVEALRKIAREPFDARRPVSQSQRLRQSARAALSKWEQAQGGTP